MSQWKTLVKMTLFATFGFLLPLSLVVITHGGTKARMITSIIWIVVMLFTATLFPRVVLS